MYETIEPVEYVTEALSTGLKYRNTIKQVSISQSHCSMICRMLSLIQICNYLLCTAIISTLIDKVDINHSAQADARFCAFSTSTLQGTYLSNDVYFQIQYRYNNKLTRPSQCCQVIQEGVEFGKICDAIEISHTCVWPAPAC